MDLKRRILKSKMVLRSLFETIGRAYIIVFLLGMIWIVYSNHNPNILEDVWFLRVMSTLLFIWVLLPLIDLIKEHKRIHDTSQSKLKEQTKQKVVNDRN